jgi:hypothetical protein
MISKFIRAKWESPGLECMDDERRQILDEAAELDHMWGAWEAEAEPTNDPNKWLKKPSLSRGDVRYHVEVHGSHREQRWEPPTASLIERDPEAIPDVDIAVKVGKDLSLDERIPRHESDEGCVRVVEHSVLRKGKEASKKCTYQGLTTFTEVDRTRTIISSAYNHVRSKRGEDERSMAMFIREEAVRSGGVPYTNVEGAAIETRKSKGILNQKKG